MLTSFSEFERATITERSRDGLHRAFKNATQLGCIPFGYDIDEAGAFVVVEEQARIVREIIASIAAGGTLYSEAKRLNDEGVSSPGRSTGAAHACTAPARATRPSGASSARGPTPVRTWSTPTAGP